jgi:hypothetical protein
MAEEIYSGAEVGDESDEESEDQVLADDELE